MILEKEIMQTDVELSYFWLAELNYERGTWQRPVLKVKAIYSAKDGKNICNKPVEPIKLCASLPRKIRKMC